MRHAWHSAWSEASHSDWNIACFHLYSICFEDFCDTNFRETRHAKAPMNICGDVHGSDAWRMSGATDCSGRQNKHQLPKNNVVWFVWSVCLQHEPTVPTSFRGSVMICERQRQIPRHSAFNGLVKNCVMPSWLDFAMPSVQFESFKSIKSEVLGFNAFSAAEAISWFAPNVRIWWLSARAVKSWHGGSSSEWILFFAAVLHCSVLQSCDEHTGFMILTVYSSFSIERMFGILESDPVTSQYGWWLMFAGLVLQHWVTKYCESLCSQVKQCLGIPLSSSIWLYLILSLCWRWMSWTSTSCHPVTLHFSIFFLDPPWST